MCIKGLVLLFVSRLLLWYWSQRFEMREFVDDRLISVRVDLWDPLKVRISPSNLVKRSRCWRQSTIGTYSRHLLVSTDHDRSAGSTNIRACTCSSSCISKRKPNKRKSNKSTRGIASTLVRTAEIWKRNFQFLFPYSICQSYHKIGPISKFRIILACVFFLYLFINP